MTGEAPWPLLVLGPAGVGKTCAGLCLLDYAVGEYHTASGLADLIARSQQGRVEWSCEGRGGTLWPEELWKRIALSRAVVLDEIGCRDRVSDHHYECVKTLIDLRHGRPLFAASNLDLEGIAKIYDDRIASRLAAGVVLALDGPDRRLPA